MKIVVEALVHADIEDVWVAWNNPADIKQWNAASDDWQTSSSEVDLRVGGKFCARMEAKDGSVGFDFNGTYERIETNSLIVYTLDDGRQVEVEFTPLAGGVKVTETFEAEQQNSPELQQQGWQSILNRFADYVEQRADVR